MKSQELQNGLNELVKEVMTQLLKDHKKEGYTLVQNGIVYYEGKWQIELMWQSHKTYELTHAGHWRV